MARKTTIASAKRSGIRSLDLVIALAWLIGFSIWFQSFVLPNNPVGRRLLWEAIPYDIMDLIDPRDQAGSLPWSWFFLLQRIPFITIAIAIWIGAWSIGSLGLRVLDPRIRGAERHFFSLCLGLSIVSLVMLSLGVCGCMSRWPLMALFVASVIAETVNRRRLQADINSVAQMSNGHGFVGPRRSRAAWIAVLVVAPFVFVQLLGAMSPQTDYDVVEYHLGGPKEWFQQGHISRLPHNVYTSFPFLSEMLTLAGMVLYGDWQWGALAGQATIAGFAPLTALGLFAAGRRWFSEGGGALAALVYLTSPWTYRISIIAYAEGGLACYVFAALFATLLFRDQCLNRELELTRRPITLALLSGLLAGSAMACKYTGLYAVVLPIGFLLIWVAVSVVRKGWRKQTAIIGLVYSMGVGVAIGPWLLKNTIETGNPVYPLAYRIFGGKSRTEELDAKWCKAHAAKSYSNWKDRLNDLPVKLTDVAAKNDWHSPLMFGLAPLSLFWCRRRRDQHRTDRSRLTSQQAILGIVWLYVAWQFFSWWIFTHLIDRFYVPMFSAVALLAGIGARWWESLATDLCFNRERTIWNWVSGGVIVASMFYNAEIMLRLGGFNAGRLDLKSALDIAVSPRLRWLNDEYESGRLPRNTKILCVGEALMFHARYPYRYETVFDASLFEGLCADSNSHDGRLKSAAQIRAEFHRLGITHIDVNWAEILRFRQPGNYGFTDFVHPDRFAELQRMGILGPPLNLPIGLSRSALDSGLRQQLSQWAPSLITTLSGEPGYVTDQIFPVLDTSEAR